MSFGLRTLALLFGAALLSPAAGLAAVVAPPEPLLAEGPRETLARWWAMLAREGVFVGAPQVRELRRILEQNGEAGAVVSVLVYDGRRLAAGGQWDAALGPLAEATARADELARVSPASHADLGLQVRGTTCGILAAAEVWDGAEGCAMDLLGAASRAQSGPFVIEALVALAGVVGAETTRWSTRAELWRRAAEILWSWTPFAEAPEPAVGTIFEVLLEAAAARRFERDVDGAYAAVLAALAVAPEPLDGGGRVDDALVLLGEVALERADASLAGWAFFAARLPTMGWARDGLARGQAHVLALRGDLVGAQERLKDETDPAARSLLADLLLLSSDPRAARDEHGALAAGLSGAAAWSERLEEAFAAWTAGDRAGALEALAALDALSVETPPPALQVRLGVVRARIVAAEGDLGGAQAALATAGPWLTAMGDSHALAALGVEYGRAALAAGQGEDARAAFDHALRFETELGLGGWGATATWAGLAQRPQEEWAATWTELVAARPRTWVAALTGLVPSDGSGRPALWPTPWFEAGNGLGARLVHDGRRSEAMGLALELAALDVAATLGGPLDDAQQAALLAVQVRGQAAVDAALGEERDQAAVEAADASVAEAIRGFGATLEGGSIEHRVDRSFTLPAAWSGDDPQATQGERRPGARPAVGRAAAGRKTRLAPNVRGGRTPAPAAAARPGPEESRPMGDAMVILGAALVGDASPAPSPRSVSPALPPSRALVRIGGWERRSEGWALGPVAAPSTVVPRLLRGEALSPSDLAWLDAGNLRQADPSLRSAACAVAEAPFVRAVCAALDAPPGALPRLRFVLP